MFTQAKAVFIFLLASNFLLSVEADESWNYANHGADWNFTNCNNS